jgi:MFS family permease
MIWGLLPMLLLSLQFTPTQIGILAAVYPTLWGLSQLFTGKLSDVYSKKWLLFWGMAIQSLAMFALVFAIQFWHFAAIGILLGFGTALVYPTFINAISDFTHPTQRAESLGTFRFWRDLGYAIGAIATGLLADSFGVNFSIAFIAILTAMSALVVVFRVKDV